jgi:site-specific DNA-methyltransferase (adenine-specific)
MTDTPPSFSQLFTKQSPVVIWTGKCEDRLKEMPDNSIDFIATDPPYGINFMGLDFDKSTPSLQIWQEVLRVMKPGAFGCVMSSPRQDVLLDNLLTLKMAGFNIKFPSIYWAYASGMNHSTNASKLVDKRAGIKREIIGEYQRPDGKPRNYKNNKSKGMFHQLDPTYNIISQSTSEDGKRLEGAYIGFQPKPAVEQIIICMKPLETKSYIEQVLKNGKGCTYLDDGRIPAMKQIGNRTNTSSPFAGDHIAAGNETWGKTPNKLKEWIDSKRGRVPAHLIVEDNVLDEANVADHQAGNKRDTHPNKGNIFSYAGGTSMRDYHGYVESFSDYFSLDLWWGRMEQSIPKEIIGTFPFLITPKPSRKEKEKGLEKFQIKLKPVLSGATRPVSQNPETRDNNRQNQMTETKNIHPTCKPYKLFSWLITMGTRPGDIVLDPFLGSGTTGIASILMKRFCLGIEMNPEYVEIANARLKAYIVPTLF